MSLLKLAPDSERLRRIARAYAAGEVDEEEYRRIRTEVIDGFVPDPHGGDDTQQRWLPEAMEEHASSAPERVRSVASRASQSARIARKHVAVWSLLGVMALIAVIALL
jgi:hypothetical protein